MSLRLIALVTLALSACQSTAEIPITSPYYEIPTGSRLVLNQTLEIPPVSATVRLQFGKIVSRFDTQDFEPVCVFESNLVAETAQRFEPDSFDIIRVRVGSGTSSAQVQPRSGLVPVSGRFIGDGGSRLFYRTELFLKSAKQPQVLAMTCQHAREAGTPLYDLRPLTIVEIRQALGDYFTVRL